VSEFEKVRSFVKEAIYIDGKFTDLVFDKSYTKEQLQEVNKRAQRVRAGEKPRAFLGSFGK
jgi:hypothetical protein